MIHESPCQAVSRSGARQRVLFWSLAFAFIVGLLGWQLQAAKPGGDGGLVSAEAAAMALAEGTENPLSAFDSDVDDPTPAGPPERPAFTYIQPTAEPREHGSILRPNPHPARAPPALPLA